MISAIRFYVKHVVISQKFEKISWNDFYIHFVKVKRKLAEVIVGIAHHGYLELDGGQSLVEFIVKQCLFPASNVFIFYLFLLFFQYLNAQLQYLLTQENSVNKFGVECMDNNDLRSFCENILHHLSTSVPNISGVS